MGESEFVLRHVYWAAVRACGGFVWWRKRARATGSGEVLPASAMGAGAALRDIQPREHVVIDRGGIDARAVTLTGRDGSRQGGTVRDKAWQASPVLGVRRVRQAAESYRDVLGFTLDPDDGVFQPTPTNPMVFTRSSKRPGVWIHFQIRRGELPERLRARVRTGRLPVRGRRRRPPRRPAAPRRCNRVAPAHGAVRHSRDGRGGSERVPAGVRPVSTDVLRRSGWTERSGSNGRQPR